MKLIRSHTFEEVELITVGYHPFGKPTLLVNLFLVDGLLIDTGPSRLYLEISKALESKTVNQIFVTHHHEDHTGNVARLSQQFDCPAYSSQSCAAVMKSPPGISFAQYMTWGSRPSFHNLQGISSLTTEQYEFQLIDIPGHAPDMVALYEPNKKWLFSADQYVHHYISYYLFSESMAQQIASLRKLLELDFETLFCCHTPPVKDGREKLKQKLHFFETFFDQVREQAEKGYSANKIMKILNLKERWGIRLLSHGMLSKLNMVKSVLNDLKAEERSDELSRTK